MALTLTLPMMLDAVAVGALVGCAAWIVPVLRALALSPPDPSRGHQPIVPLIPARHDPDREGAGGWPPSPPPHPRPAVARGAVGRAR